MARWVLATDPQPGSFRPVALDGGQILALEDSDWEGVAHDSGFADQPHLVRDIKERFGAAPRRSAAISAACGTSCSTAAMSETFKPLPPARRNPLA
jgi:AraC-like DNA-binding protein